MVSVFTSILQWTIWNLYVDLYLKFGYETFKKPIQIEYYCPKFEPRKRGFWKTRADKDDGAVTDGASLRLHNSHETKLWRCLNGNTQKKNNFNSTHVNIINI